MTVTTMFAWGRNVLSKVDRDGNSMNTPVWYIAQAQAAKKAATLRANGYAAVAFRPAGDKGSYVVAFE